jgi:hypothetical protein
MNVSAKSIATLDRHFHICAFFNSREEEYEALTPFYREGIEAGEKSLHIVAPAARVEHLARLALGGIDAEECLRCGQLEVVGWDEAYLEHGRFDPHMMLTKVETMIAAGRDAGYPRTRLMGNMQWAFAHAPGVTELIEYEARVNDVLERHRQPAVCVYDASWLSGTTMMDILRCHPLALVRGVVRHNPFFVPPGEFLRQFGARTARQASQWH